MYKVEHTTVFNLELAFIFCSSAHTALLRAEAEMWLAGETEVVFISSRFWLFTVGSHELSQAGKKQFWCQTKTMYQNRPSKFYQLPFDQGVQIVIPPRSPASIPERPSDGIWHRSEWPTLVVYYINCLQSRPNSLNDNYVHSKWS